MFDQLPDWIRQARSQIPSDRASNVSGLQSGSQSRSLLQHGNLPLLALNNLIFGEHESVNELMLQEMLPELVCNELVEYPFITPSEEDIYGPINIGHCLETGAPAGIYPNEVHTLIAGGTGSGKTTLITRLIRQHINTGIPVLIFDLENEFPELLDDNRINVRGVENLNWNPLEVPPGVNPVLYLQDFCAILSDTLGLLIGSKGFLLKQIHRLYELYGVFEGSNVFPSLIDLNDFLLGKLQRTKSNTREYTYTEVCSNRFDSLTKALPHILDCSSGMPLHILTRSNLIILLNGIDSEYQTLLITLMLAWLCRHRIANGLRNNPEYDLAVFLDEAQRLYDRQMDVGYIREFQP